MTSISTKKSKKESKKMIALDNTATKQTHGNSSQHTQSTRSTYSSECTQDDSSDIRQEIDNCQEQLSKLHSMVKQLVDDLDDGKPIKKSKKKKNQKIRKYDDLRKTLRRKTSFFRKKTH